MKKTENIATAAMILAVSILASRLLGYVREMLLAYKFGASGTTDAFYAAFQIPDILNNMLAGGELSIAFIPLYHKIFARDGEAAAQRLMATLLGNMGVLVLILTGLLWYFADPLIRMQFPNFDAKTTDMTVTLTRIVLPAQIFFIVGGIIQAVLLAHKHFYAAALAPLVYNLCTILGGVFLYDSMGIAGFSIGTLIGAALGPLLMPVLFSFRHIPLKIRIAPRDRNFLIYLAIAAPLMLGTTLLTLDEWYGRWFGALLATGTVAHISYARRLMQVPIAVIGQAIGAAALPTLSKLWSEGKTAELNKTLLSTLNTGIALSVLAGAGFFALAQPIVALVYQHGKFLPEDTLVVAGLTALLAFAIPGWIVQQIISRAFYARGDTLRPMKLGTLLSLLAIPLYKWMAQHFGVYGLAMAGVLAMTINAVATLGYARKLHDAPPFMPQVDAFLRSLGIAVPAVLAALTALWLRGHYFSMPGVEMKWVALADIALGGAAFGLIALPAVLMFGEDGLKKFIHRIGSKVLGR
ncbi:MAG TPA: murein biosynthesis integral membrane protein MurJ [Patescibacteria group bacterium]|nr:murein biosynthesis integral membrane protein MurJ [Patescibacteria group bacterium]